METALFLDEKIEIMHPKLFSQTFQSNYFQNASELHSKQLRFWTQKSRKCAQNFFHKPRIAKTSKMHPNFTANCFVLKCKNREIVPRTLSVKLSSRELPECN